jgi:centrosomal protein CEP97
MKQHMQHVTPPETASSVISTEDEDDDDDSDKINVEKLKSIRKTAQKCQKQKENQHQIQQQQESLKQIGNKETENSAILIQKLWRGYATRKKTKSIADVLQKKRTQDYIVKLSKDMEMTKQALENERKIQQLQMQAINALWKKVSTMPDGTGGVVVGQTASGEGLVVSGDSNNIVQDLTKTCTVLTNQVSSSE